MALLSEELGMDAVLDAGPLFTALVLHYIRVARVTGPKRTSLLKPLQTYMRSEASQEAYLSWFASIRTPSTTSHVIGELQRLSNTLKLSAEDRKYFWMHSMRFLKERNFSEELLRLLDMYHHEISFEGVCRLGPTDMGLIALAKSEDVCF